MTAALRPHAAPRQPWAGLLQFVRARLIGWGFIAILALVALFSARLALNTQYKTPRPAAAIGQKHAPDFTATQFTLWRNSLDGTTQYQVSGDTITHYRDDLSSVLIKPLIVAKTQSTGAAAATNAITTTITANDGLIRNDGELVQLMGKVHVQRTTRNTSLSSLQTDSLILAPDVDLVVSRSPVTLTQAKNQSTAQGGISYSHADAVLQLAGNVHTTIAPK